MMLPPELINRLKREKEERERPVAELPLVMPEPTQDDRSEKENEHGHRIVTIEL